MIRLLSQVDIRNMGEGFGGVLWKDVTNVHPLGLAAVLILGVIMLAVPRRWAFLPIFVMACFVSSVQKIVVFSLDFNFLRIMVLFGVLRIISRREFTRFIWRPCDKVIMLWTICGTVIYVLQQGTISALVNKMGASFDILGIYFVIRCLIREWGDLKVFLVGSIATGVIVIVFFGLEARTGRNVFSIFGGVPAIMMVRQGRLRCQGAFQHPIQAGTFWAAMWPLYVAQWWGGYKGKIWAVVATVVVWFIVFACASSTPVMALISGIIGGIMFVMRRHMRMVRRGIVLTLIALHLVMQAPVWHLISRVSAVGGSTGYFRYMLVDAAIRNFREWAILGTKSTAHWFWGAQDVTNQYVLEGVRGGALTLALYIILIAFSFKEVGYLWRAVSRDKEKLAMAWGLGVCLLVHCMIGIGGAYIGKSLLVLLFTFAAITSMAAAEQARRPDMVKLCTANNKYAVSRSYG
ncbi:MAG: hypothetical protein DRP66_04035 [Planctomycetota bacterium]|nr:MAG: hypothetical protein DRP66_04035 [Planctomycetota bacterium]